DVLKIRANLHVIPAQGWRRDEWFDLTGLPWVKPSPNMPSLQSAILYPGLVAFEATNLSVGRGTPDASQRVGAPWLHAAATVAIQMWSSIASIGRRTHLERRRGSI